MEDARIAGPMRRADTRHSRLGGRFDSGHRRAGRGCCIASQAHTWRMGGAGGAVAGSRRPFATGSAFRYDATAEI